VTVVDWLLTEQLVQIFRDAKAKQPDLNVELESRSPHGEDDVLAGAGIAVRIDATDGSVYLLTPKRLARLVGDEAYTMLSFPDMVGYDWISPEMSKKVEQKEEHYDRLYLYPRSSPPITLDNLGRAVYPLLAFFARVLEFQSQKVLRRKMDEETIEALGKSLEAAAHGPFFDDQELEKLFGRSRPSMEVIASMWPRMNLAAPDLRELLARVVRELVERNDPDAPAWKEWIGSRPEKLEGAVEVFRRVSTGEV
jgi:hypothetical protein